MYRIMPTAGMPLARALWRRWPAAVDTDFLNVAASRPAPYHAGEHGVLLDPKTIHRASWAPAANFPDGGGPRADAPATVAGTAPQATLAGPR